MDWQISGHAWYICCARRVDKSIARPTAMPELKAARAVQAFGNAAMILASGKKGNRFALPHSRIMTAPPRINRSFGSTSNIMIKANELEYNTQTYVDFLSATQVGTTPHSVPLHTSAEFMSAQ